MYMHIFFYICSFFPQECDINSTATKLVLFSLLALCFQFVLDEEFLTLFLVLGFWLWKC